jgi:putative membrane protein
MSGWGMGWGAGLLALFAVLAVVAIVVAVVVAATRTVGDGGPPRGPDEDALRLLDARFARGEIDEEDYLRRRSLLSR